MIEKKDGQIIKGELLAVKENRLIIMDSASLSGITLYIDELRVIRVVRKSKFFQGLGCGLLTGGTGGALLGFLSGDDPPGWFSMTAGQKALFGGLAFGILGAPIGGIWGAIKGIDESIVLEGRLDEEMILILKKMNSKSRFPIESPSSLKITNATVKKEAQHPINKKVNLNKQVKFKERLPHKPQSKKFSRIHLTIEADYFKSQGVKDYEIFFKDSGFGDTKPGGTAGFLWFEFGSYESRDYPIVHKDPVFYFTNIRMEYSISSKFALGVGYSPLGNHEIHGYKYIPINNKYYTELYILGDYSASLYYMTCSWMPIPDAFLKKSAIKIGAGIGLSTANMNFRTSEYEYSDGKEDKVSLSKNNLVLMAFAEYDYYFSRNVSIGININYKYVPVRIDSFQLAGHYLDLDEHNNLTYSSSIFYFPEKRLNFGGFGIGLNFGFHF